MFVLFIICTAVVFVVCFLVTSSRFNLIACLCTLGFWVLYSYSMTEANAGAETLEHEEGVSLRQDSSSIGTRSLFVFYSRRSHMGGGLAGGK